MAIVKSAPRSERYTRRQITASDQVPEKYHALANVGGLLALVRVRKNERRVWRAEVKPSRLQELVDDVDSANKALQDALSERDEARETVADLRDQLEAMEEQLREGLAYCARLEAANERLMQNAQEDDRHRGPHSQPSHMTRMQEKATPLRWPPISGGLPGSKR